MWIQPSWPAGMPAPDRDLPPGGVIADADLDPCADGIPVWARLAQVSASQLPIGCGASASRCQRCATASRSRAD